MPGGGRLGRSWRRFRRRPFGVQLVAVIVTVAVIVGVVFAVGAGSPSGSKSSTTSTVVLPVHASTSMAGVTAHTINVVFPVSNLSSLAASFGFAGDVEYSEQTKAIKLFVKPINDAGGINGRKIESQHRQLRPHQRGGHAGPVQAVDRGQRSRLRRPRRGRHLDGRQPALHHPGRPHAPAEPVDDGDQLDHRKVRPTCGGRAPTTPPSCRPPSTGASAPASSGTASRWG